jgi:hypothetical protein
VVDTSAAGADVLSQTLSGAAGYLLRLPPATPVTVTADGGTPRRVTSVPGPPADAIQALTTLRAGGERSTARALELAVAALPSPAGPRGRGLVLLATSGAPPEGEAGADLQDRLEDAGVVLAVVTAPQFARAWAGLADATGGTAAGVRGDAVPDAFDEVARALRGRSVITFAAPAGTASAELRVRSGGDLLSADVSLPGGEQQQAGGGTTGTGARGAQDEPAQAPGDDTRRGVAVAVVALQLAAAAVVLLVRRRRREQSRSEQQDEDVPQGVRLFDVSDPLAPVELDRARGDRGRLAVGTPADRPDQDEVRDQSA